MNSVTKKLIIRTVIFITIFSAVQWKAGEKAEAFGSAGTSLNSGLVARWTFDGKDISWGGASGTTTVNDVSGNGYSGSVFGSTAATASAVGKEGQAFRFYGQNGISRGIDVGTSASLNPSRFTITAWVKIASSTYAYNYIYSNARDCCGTPYNGIDFFITSGHQIWGTVWNGTAVTLQSGVNSVPVNTWTQVAFSFDGTTMKIYKNGILLTSVATTTSVGSPASFHTYLGAMGYGNGASYILNGSLDDVRLYNRALTNSEVYQVYKMGNIKAGSLPTPNMSSSGTTGINNGLAAYWTFDGKNITSTTALDSSGNGDIGTLHSSPIGVSGAIGQGLNFNGVNQYIDVGNPSNLNFGPNQDFSFSFWEKTTGTSGKPISKSNVDTSTVVGWGIFQSANGIYLKVTNGTTAVYQAPVVGVNDGKWHHIVFSVSRNGSCNRYIDGVLAGSTSVSSWASLDITNTTNVDIAAHNGTSPFGFWGGSMDDMRVYRRALSSSDVAQLYRAGTVKNGVSYTKTTSINSGLVGYWTFDGKNLTTATATDSSGQGNNGTLMNTPVPSFGKIGQALYFDGANNAYVQVSNESPYDFTSNFSVSLWVKPSTSWGNTYRALIGKSSGSVPNTGWDVGIGTNGKARMTLRGTSVLDTQGSFGPDLRDGKWHHIVFLNTNSSIKTYVDGVLYGTTSGTWTSATNSLPLLLGNREPGASTEMYGSMDDIRVYGRTLSSSEMFQLYRMGGSKAGL